MTRREQISQKLVELKLVKSMLENEQQRLSEATQQLEAALEAQKIVQTIAAGVQQKVHQRMAGIVTRCLQTIFNDSYGFKIYFEEKRGKTEARLVLLREDKEMDPTSASGGGVVDVIAFALRLAAVLLTRPAPRHLMVLDEPFRYLSRNHGERVRELIEQLAVELDMQFLIITHDEELLAGRVITL